MTRGITMTAGGETYFLNAYLNIRILRMKGCKMPVSWFYLGDEMRDDWIRAAEEIEGVKTFDLGGSGDHCKGRGGWQSKIEAVIRSPFDEVLLLDSDSFPVRDPAYLFDHCFYREVGAVLWPDIWHWQPDRLEFLNKKYGISLEGTRQIESGQAMLDKTRCMAALEAVRKLNQDSQETYKVLYGDKDTFLVGFLQAKVPFRIVPTLPGCLYMGLFQHDFDGRKEFAHLTGGKFKWHGRAFISEADLPGVVWASKIAREMRSRGLHPSLAPRSKV